MERDIRKALQRRSRKAPNTATQDTIAYITGSEVPLLPIIKFKVSF